MQSKEGVVRKDVDAIAKIIRENSFDIIAIQEIFNKEALKELLEKISNQYAEVSPGNRLLRGNYETDTYNIGSRMNASYGYRTKHWEGRWAQPISNFGGNIAEGYAFIWNRDRIKLVTNMKGETFEPRIADFGGASRLVRPPFLGRFMPINGSYEFRLINTHIVYAVPGKRLEEDEDNESEISQADLKDYELRRQEFETLVRTIYVDYSEQKYDKTGHDRFARNLVPYTFILGDYNLNMSNVRGQSSARMDAMQESMTIKSKGLLNVVTVNSEFTTLKGRPRDEEKVKLLQQDSLIEHHLANNYDHFSYDRNLYIRHQISDPEVGTILAFEMFKDVETQDTTKYDIYRSKVSDHLPICLEIDIRKKRTE